MTTECAINWSTSDVLAIVSVLIAGASALIAYISAREAKTANKLTLYAHRLPTYQAFIELSMHMLAKRRSAEVEEVSRFYHFQETAFLYFDDGVAQELKDYYGAAFAIADEHRANPNLANKSELVEKYLATIDRLNGNCELRKKLQKALGRT